MKRKAPSPDKRAVRQYSLSVGHSKEKPKMKFRLFFIVLFIFSAFSVCFVKYMDATQYDPKDIAAEMAQKEKTADEPKNYAYSNPLRESTPKESSYLTGSMVIGADNALALFRNGILEREGIYMLSEKDSVSDALRHGGYEAIYIMADGSADGGIDNLSVYDMCSELVRMLTGEEYHPCIYIVSAFPEHDGYERSDDDISADRLNSMLLDIADDLGCYYVDINTYLKNSSGRMKKEYLNDDGTINSDGCRFISDFLLSHTVG